jgi:branched-chain amino acid transport system substrate-binding protein
MTTMMLTAIPGENHTARLDRLPVTGIVRKLAPLFGLAMFALSLLIPLGAQAADPGITKTAIKIGIFGPLSGPASSFGESELGIAAIYKDLNAHGGIYGRKIDILMEDTACVPAKGIAAVKKLVSLDRVFMLHGGSCSDVIMALKPSLAKSGIPYMVCTAASTLISKPLAADIFQNVPTTEAMGRTEADFAMSKPGPKRIALVSQSDDWGKSGHDPAVDELKTKYHVTPIADVTLERGSIDATPQVLQLKVAKPSFVVTVLYPAPFAIFLRDAAKYGLTTPVIGSQAISIEDTANQLKNSAEMNRVYVFYPMAGPIESARMAKWRAIFQKYNPGVRLETSSLLGMGGAEALIAALKKAGPEPTRAKVIAALNSLHDFDTGVMADPIRFSPADHAGAHGGAMITYLNNKLMVIRRYREAPK